MRDKIHPEWYPDARLVCVCGNSFTVGSVKQELRVEICGTCHPFYTGEQRIVDTEGRVERLKRRYGLQ